MIIIMLIANLPHMNNQPTTPPGLVRTSKDKTIEDTMYTGHSKLQGYKYKMVYLSLIVGTSKLIHNDTLSDIYVTLPVSDLRNK